MLAESGTEVVYLLRKEFKRWVGPKTHVYPRHIDITDEGLMNRILEFDLEAATKFYNEETALKALYESQNSQTFFDKVSRIETLGKETQEFDMSRFKNIETPFTPADVKRIERAGGNAAETLRFTRKGTNYYWLENGNSSFGWKHILERHYPGYPAGPAGKAPSLLPNVPQSEIKNKMIEVLENGVEVPANVGNKGYLYKVSFSDGTSREMLVIVNNSQYNGSITSFYEP